MTVLILHIDHHVKELLRSYLQIDENNIELLLSLIQKDKTTAEYELFCYELKEILYRIKKLERQIEELEI